MFEKIAAVFSERLGCSIDSVSAESLISDDLGADSLDIVEIIMTIEEKFGVDVPDEDIPGFKTVGDVVAYIESNM